MVLLVSPIEITVHKTMDKTSQTAFVSSHSGGVYSGLAKLSNTISFLLSGRIRNLPDLIISQLNFRHINRNLTILHFDKKLCRLLTDWGE